MAMDANVLPFKVAIAIIRRSIKLNHPPDDNAYGMDNIPNPKKPIKGKDSIEKKSRTLVQPIHGMVRLRFLTTKQIYPPKTSNCNWNVDSDFKKQQCLSLLKSCSSLDQLFQIHAQILIAGLQKDEQIVDKIIQFCALHPSGSLNHARRAIKQSENQIPSSWNNLIRGYATKGDSPREAIWVFLAMRRSRTRPNELTYPFLFKASATFSGLKEGRQIHTDVLKHGVDDDVYVQNTVIHFYGSCKKIVDACRMFDEMLFRTLVSWNSIISSCVDNLWFYESIKYFVRMRNCGLKPDETTMVILLSACAELGNLNLGKWAHAQVIEKGLVVNCQLGTSLVDMYAKCGAVDYASLVFDATLERNVWTWSAMILGLAQHGFATKALELFRKMKKNVVQPNYVTFLGVLCACSHAGLVEDGHRFFHEMENVHGIKPMMIHYGAMVDVLGRAGHLKEAYNFIIDMPIKPDAIVWRTLLGACNIHDLNDYNRLGEKVREKLLELEPRRSGNFIMVANKYAEAGKWDKAAHVRSSISNRGLKKMAGESLIEVRGSIHRFFSGEDDQVDCDSISLLLDILNLHMKMVNYE
ncbi:unnamed protein product [Ilex paraguariensis]|uniref:Chlororespiratory reduction 2 n=1 Tax=Ilex paraguariensis TaxID=185542 RepID=A0ABC8T0F0_9AQUA